MVHRNLMFLSVLIVFIFVLNPIDGYNSPSWFCSRAITGRTSKTPLFSQNSYESVVESLHSKTRLDIYLAEIYSDRSRSFLSQLCEKGSVSVNNQTQSKQYKVKSGDRISIVIEDKEVSFVEPECIPLDIIYEDDHIIAVNKPQGMVVHPGAGSPNGTFVNALLYHLGPDAKKLLEDAVHIDSDEDFIIDDDEIDSEMDAIGLDLPETPEAAKASPISLRPGIIHRLDKGTTGVLLAGKTSDAVSKMSSLFALRKIRKIYLSICIGHPGRSVIAEPIGRSTKNRQIMCIYDGPPGKPAVTHVRTLTFDGKLSAAILRIETGRTHQIRVHMKARRTPILGDEAYGNKDWNKKLWRTDGIQRPLLHAYEIEFVHPYTNELLTIKAAVPEDMKRIIQRISPAKDAVVREDDGLLVGNTDVNDRSEEDAMFKENRGFVPSDRLIIDEIDWTTVDLPETMDHWYS